MAEVQVREATPDDAGALWDWANDPATRAMSFSTDPIPWADHVAWLDRVLADPARVLLVGEVDGEPVGTVRFDRDDDVAEVSITVAPVARGRGLAASILDAACDRVDVPVIAHVRPDNIPSVRLFSRWRDVGEVEERGVLVRRFVLDR